MTAAAKNVHIDMIDNIVDKDNSTYHKTIKMKNLLMLKQIHVFVLMLQRLRKILNLKFVIL